MDQLADLSARYGTFYAPAFSVRVGSDDLVRDLLLAVSQIEVELVLGAASRFSFTVCDCYDHEGHQFQTGRGVDPLKLLEFGTQIAIGMGYGDAKSTPTIMLGMITEISTSFPDAGSPELVIAGYDHGYPLTLGKNSDSWKDRADSDVVHMIAGFHNLNAVIESTSERHPQIEQSQESDWNLLKKLADRNSDQESNHFELYVDIDERKQPVLHFGKPKLKAAPLCKLNWGSGLLNFRPQANVAGQVSKVEVYGRDEHRAEVIVGRASADDTSGKTKAPGQYLKAFVRAPEKQPTLRLRQPVFTQAEADQRAKAALSELTQKFLTGEGEAIGIPTLRPDRTVMIGNLGDAFSRPYYIEQVTHKIDAGGYRTRFKVRETKL
ncbi:phage late control D family protein [Paraburkholderia terrae]|uniref:phage late control D family protein n=1 Tax=Paraburkholderia terrae TaxID=311230 RepID=UPI00296AEC70|nr:hypothetical protein [Paraburkholderia terrae]MDW3660602.1 hypothetical protein [Paraburkholderia terrae]